MVWGLERFSPPDEEVALVLEASGIGKAGPAKVRVVVENNDACYITAVPVVACVRQYLNGKIRPGLNIMGHAVDPERLVEDMRRMGVTVELSIS